MDITLDKKESNVASVKIKLNEDDYREKVNEKIKDYRKKVRIKGFRPGKVPAGVIKKMYGKSILIDTINHLVSQSLQDYIRDSELKTLGEPIPNQQQVETVDWEHQRDFEFEYKIGLVEDFEVKLDNKVKVKSYKITVEDKGINQAIENLQMQFGKMTNPDESEEGDTLYGTFKQVHGEIEHTTTLDLSELDPKAQKQFTGRGQNDVIEVDLNKLMKEEVSRAALIGKTADELADLDGAFTFTIKNVNRRVAAEINQELFDRTFGPGKVTTEEEFRAKIEETISQNYERETNAFLTKTIRDELVKNTAINLPDEFLKEWLKLTGEGKVTDENLEKEYNVSADQLRWNLISGEIAKKNEIKPEYKEIQEAAKTMINAQFGNSDLEQLSDQIDGFVDNYLQAENSKNYMEMAGQVQEGKIIDFIKEKISIEEKVVNVETFEKMIEN